MMDLLAHLIYFCASCVSDNNAVPAAVGALGGAAAAAGGLGGLGGLSSGDGNHANSGGLGNDGPVDLPAPPPPTPPPLFRNPDGSLGSAGDGSGHGGLGDLPPPPPPPLIRNPDGSLGSAPVGNSEPPPQPSTGPGDVGSHRAPSGPTQIPWPSNTPVQISASPPDSTSTAPSNAIPENSAPPAAAASPNSVPPGPANSTITPDGKVTTTYGDGTTTYTTPDGTVTTVKPDGSTNVNSTLPPPGGGFSTGPGATDANDPQQGQQPIGFTNHELTTTTSTDPSKIVDPNATIGATETVSDMPNTAHVQGPSTGTGPHKPPNP